MWPDRIRKGNDLRSHADRESVISISFPVAEIKQNSSQVEVRSRSGQTVFADHMICTILLNVLSDVKSDKRSTL
jgi:monoamine oxidase